MSHVGFEFEIGSHSPDQLFVTSFDAVEAISRPFELEVSFFPRDGEPLDLQELLGQESKLLIPTPAGDRWFHGEVHGARSLGEHGGRRRYEVRIGPKVGRLAHLKRSRAFQAKTVVEVIQAVLDEGKVKHRAAASGSYPKLEFCVQYNCSDLDFILSRAEANGLFHLYEHSDSGHELVLGDGTNAFTPLAGGDTLPYRLEGETPEEEYVAEVLEVHRLRTGSVVLKDFDPLRPALDVSGKETPGPLELYDYPAEATSPSEAAALATARMEERGQGKLTLDLKTHCPRLVPGALFSLSEHPEERFNRKLLVVEVQHHGRRRETLGEPEAFAQIYRNEVRCLPEGTPFRPARRTPQPKVSGLQTATVTGAAGEEIHPDEHGRVKVQFHWDREGKKDDKSSAWVRVAQSWGGPGWGALFVPRVGHEVVVRFLEGNPDRPIVVGSVYNGSNPPAAHLPGEKTQSAIQTSSSPGGSGHNELRFEDAARDELITLHSQKDLTAATVNDKKQDVGQNESLEVGRDRTLEVERHQSHEVILNDTVEVTKNQSSTILKNRTSDVTGGDSESVESSQSTTVAGLYSVSAKTASTETVTLVKTLTVGGAALTVVGATHAVGVGLLRTETIAGARTEIIAQNRDENVEKNRTAKVKGEDHLQTKEGLVQGTGKDGKVQVDGNFELGAKEGGSFLAKKMELKADSKLNLIVGGKLLLSIDSGGNITVNAKTITVEGK
ncbi:MAG TPA: type VI secretion system tip protein TssI/VgrG [Myxococcaceae bacterium]|jgi:type VI secretion system secreted protein VgrG